MRKVRLDLGLGRWILLTSPQFSQARRSKDVEDGEIIPSLKVRLGVQANDKRRQVFHPINVQGGVNFDKSTAEYV